MVDKASSLMGFHQIDNNKVHRSTFDLSRRNLFTSKIGELLPVFCEEVVPGDDFKVNMQHFSRSMPVQTAAFTRLRENVQFFFVPYTALYYRFRECMQNMTKGQNGQNISRSASSPLDNKDLTTELPYILMRDIYQYLAVLLNYSDDNENDISDDARFNQEDVLRISDSAKLLMSLGYGNFTELSKITAVQNRDGTYSLQLNGKILGSADLQTFYNDIVNYANQQKTAVSPFRLLAYHRIANDYYRYMQWQPWRSYSCNVDYLNGSTANIFGSAPTDNTQRLTWYKSLIGAFRNIFDMEYSNLPLDYFNGAIPNQQFGDESVVKLASSDSSVLSGDIRIAPPDGAAAIRLNDDGLDESRPSSTPSSVFTQNSLKNDGTYISDMQLSGLGDPIFCTDLHGKASLDTGVVSSSELSIIALRKATALQRYKEIQNCHDADFVDQVKAHFGVTPADNGEKSVFLGGYSSVFDINPQVNQNLTGDNVANIQAAPTAQGNGSFHFKARDYGVIIGLYRITPQLDYAQLGLDRKLLLTDAADYPIPELDSIGMQETLPSEIYTTDIGALFSDSTGVLMLDSMVKGGIGYAPRYSEWKIAHDSYQGAYLSTLKTWVTGQDVEALYNWFHYLGSDTLADKFASTTPYLLVCKPSLCRNIFVNNNFFGGVDNDQFMVGAYISVIAKRNLSRYGLPY
jgi:hypothetical protein